MNKILSISLTALVVCCFGVLLFQRLSKQQPVKQSVSVDALASRLQINPPYNYTDNPYCDITTFNIPDVKCPPNAILDVTCYELWKNRYVECCQSQLRWGCTVYQIYQNNYNESVKKAYDNLLECLRTSNIPFETCFEIYDTEIGVAQRLLDTRLESLSDKIANSLVECENVFTEYILTDCCITESEKGKR